MWAQSLYITGKLLQEDLLAPGELDPMNRRLSMLKKPDVVVQVVVIAEDNDDKNLMAEHNMILQTREEIAPIQVQSASMLSHLYTFLGRSKKLGLTGRRSHDVGILATSKIYQIQDKNLHLHPPGVRHSDELHRHRPQPCNVNPGIRTKLSLHELDRHRQTYHYPNPQQHNVRRRHHTPPPAHNPQETEERVHQRYQSCSWHSLPVHHHQLLHGPGFPG